MKIFAFLVVSSCYCANPGDQLLDWDQMRNLHCAQELTPLQNQVRRVELLVYDWNMRSH
jgi:hypothetical protein